MTALMYHDIVPTGAEDSSGFPGRDAALYKVTPETFNAHLDAILMSARRALRSADFTATFDDGGVTAMVAADALEARGLRGHFFVTVNYVGSPGFLTKADVVELSRRGHVIGSHTCSHPLRIGHCAWPQLLREWTRSREVLSDSIAQDVHTASVPGGDFSASVALSAAEAGYTRLFTSEPTSVTRSVHGLTLSGRFAIRRWTSAASAAALAAGDFLPCTQQAVLWNARKALKRAAGDRYLRLRKFLLRHGDEVRWGDDTV